MVEAGDGPDASVEAVVHERRIGPLSEKGVESLGGRVEEKAREEPGNESGGPRPVRRGFRDGERKEEASGTGTAAFHDQAFARETTASMMQAEPPTSLRARMSSIVCPGTRIASLAPLPYATVMRRDWCPKP